MGKTKIEGLIITPLKQIADERGAVLHFLKYDSPNFKEFGESYFSKINEGVIKGWKFHKKAYQNFCVPFGTLKIVVFDNREDSTTQGVIEEIILDDFKNYFLLSMPPCLWYSFKCESKNFALLSNITNITHSPEESKNLLLETKEIPYEWK